MNTHKAIEEVRRKEKFFLLIEKGGEEAVKELNNMFLTDPKRYLFDNAADESLANKKSLENETPLYIACKHGHFPVIFFSIIISH